MNSYLIENIDYFYNYAESLSKQYGKDVVHHIATEIPDQPRHPKTYITTCIRNALYNKYSSFNKLYRPEDVPAIEETYNGKYDAFMLHRILLELECKGYHLHVALFKDAYLGSSVNAVAKKIEADRRTVNKICKFVKNEIHRRYIELDSN